MDVNISNKRFAFDVVTSMTASGEQKSFQCHHALFELTQQRQKQHVKYSNVVKN